MKPYKLLVKEFLAEYAGALRKHRNLTQDEMAEQLRITGRAYGDMERRKYCFSAHALLFLLLMLREEEIKCFLEKFRKQADEMERREVA